MDPTCVFNFFTFFERILYKSNCIIFIFSWCGTHTKIRSKLVVIVKAGSQKITLWGPQRTPIGILSVKTRNIQVLYPNRRWWRNYQNIFTLHCHATCWNDFQLAVSTRTDEINSHYESRTKRVCTKLPYAGVPHLRGHSWWPPTIVVTFLFV